ncbi:hypothetical protein LX32DRAFT_583385 [Colletotrichum zoysiae]|uniref:Uncharacterized protein n=1 Tax=Colletotrichum zoysiae TaxID=1216348 RepID=A0AAD9HNJ1_9PEZI|nr:hypothetical protein LX32DRAFT_583385 [Colletotrichum zoysiae]
MAAKDLNPYRTSSRPWLVRRPIRVRSRTPVPLKVTTEATDDLKVAETPAMRSVGVPSPSPAATASSPVVSSEKTEGGAKPAVAAREINPSDLPLPTSPSNDCKFTDFSNLLGINVQPPPEGDPMVVDNTGIGSYCRAAPDEDIYGWDAELERQGRLTSPVMANPYDEACQYRRTSVTKRSLLHRVFSMGNSPRDFDDNEVCRSSSTSS